MAELLTSCPLLAYDWYYLGLGLDLSIGPNPSIGLGLESCLCLVLDIVWYQSWYFNGFDFCTDFVLEVIYLCFCPAFVLVLNQAWSQSYILCHI